MTTQPVKIICPNCDSIEDAVVEDCWPSPIYVHTCKNCGYVIMESEWNEIKAQLSEPKVSCNGFVSGCCEGEKCSVCGKPATNKLEETIFHDDPYPIRHPLTAYVCKDHFRMIVGSLG